MNIGGNTIFLRALELDRAMAITLERSSLNPLLYAALHRSLIDERALLYKQLEKVFASEIEKDKRRER